MCVYFIFIYIPLECTALSDNMMIIYNILFYFIRLFPIVLVLLFSREEFWGEFIYFYDWTYLNLYFYNQEDRH